MVLILNTGNALYDGIIGALGAIIFITALFIIQNYKALWRERHSIILWAQKQLNKYISKMTKTIFTENNIQETKESLSSSNNDNCKKSGKEAPEDSPFCNNGSSRQVGIASNLFTNLSVTKRIGLVLTAIWFVSQIVLLYADNQGEDYRDDEVWFVDTNFSDYYAYGNGEFVFYALLIPAILWGLSYIFELSKKIGFTIIVITTFVLGGYFCKGKYQQYQVEQREKAYKDSIEASKNAPKINRTFAECSLGDSYDVVKKKINTIYSNDSIVYFCGVRNNSLYYDDHITLYDVVYGNRTYNKISFYFYQDKLYKVYFRKKYESYNSKMSAYNTFTDLFNEKNYPHDMRYDKYNNSHYYSDKYTRLELRYSVSEFDGEKQYIGIEYYDKTSGKEESGL